MKCDQVMVNLMSYYDGELGGALEREVRAHLEICSDCAATLKMVADADRAVSGDLPDREYFDGLTRRVMEAVQQEEAPVAMDRRRWFSVLTGWPARRLAPAVSLALVVMVALGVWMRTGGRISVKSQPPAGKTAVVLPDRDNAGSNDGEAVAVSDREKPGNEGYYRAAGDGVAGEERLARLENEPPAAAGGIARRTGEAASVKPGSVKAVSPESAGEPRPAAGPAHEVVGKAAQDLEQPERRLGSDEIRKRGNGTTLSEKKGIPSAARGQAKAPPEAKDKPVVEQAAAAESVETDDNVAPTAQLTETSPLDETAPPADTADLMAAAKEENVAEPASKPAPPSVPETGVDDRGPGRSAGREIPVAVEEALGRKLPDAMVEIQAEPAPEIEAPLPAEGTSLPAPVTALLDSYFGRGAYVIMYNRDINGDGIREIVAVQPLPSGRERSFTYDPVTQAPLSGARQFTRGLVVQEVDGGVRQQLAIDSGGVQDALANRAAPAGSDLVYTLRQDTMGDPRNLVLNAIPVAGSASSDDLVIWDETSGVYVLDRAR